MASIRGWAPRGCKLVARAPAGKWRTLTFLAALRHDGLTASWIIDPPVNRKIFEPKSKPSSR